MHISLEAVNKSLRLNLGASWLVLTPAEATNLQVALTQLQPNAWNLPTATWQAAQEELANLPSLLDQATGLAKSQRQQVFSKFALTDCLALARFSRQAAKPLSKKLTQSLATALSTKALKDEFTEELASVNKSSALEVAAAKANLIQALTDLGIQPNLTAGPTPKAKTINPEEAAAELAAKAKNYLAYLAKLPANQIKVILRNLVSAEIGWLVSACKTLGVDEFNQKLAEILPAASWQKLNANCPAELAPEKLKQLSASLGLAFKQLHKHLQAKGDKNA